MFGAWVTAETLAPVLPGGWSAGVVGWAACRTGGMHTLGRGLEQERSVGVPAAEPDTPPPCNSGRKGEWDEVHIPLHRFLLTYKGHLVEQHVEMNPARILSFGLSLAGGDYEAEGPFRLGVDWIKAVNSRSMELPVSERNM